jgi:hypothetical protein
MERLRHNTTFYLSFCCVIILTILILGCGGPAQSEGNSIGSAPATVVNVEGNQAPIIDAIIPEWTSVERTKTTKIEVIAHDPDGDTLTYSWSCTRGSLSGKGTIVTYTAPAGYIDDNPIVVSVSDGRGGAQYSSINMPVVCCSHAQKNPDWKP